MRGLPVEEGVQLDPVPVPPLSGLVLEAVVEEVHSLERNI